MSENYTRKQNGSGGMASATRTPANANVGLDKAKMFDAKGTIGKQFTGTYAVHLSGLCSSNVPVLRLCASKHLYKEQREEHLVPQHRRSEVLLLQTGPLASSSPPEGASVAQYRTAWVG